VKNCPVEKLSGRKLSEELSGEKFPGDELSEEKNSERRIVQQRIIRAKNCPVEKLSGRRIVQSKDCPAKNCPCEKNSNEELYDEKLSGEELSSEEISGNRKASRFQFEVKGILESRVEGFDISRFYIQYFWFLRFLTWRWKFMKLLTMNLETMASNLRQPKHTPYVFKNRSNPKYYLY
jgi:hypothetical protein